MQKLIASITLFTLVIVLLSSCSHTSTLALTKRHYRSGYYVNWGSGKNSLSTPVIAKATTRSELKQSLIHIEQCGNPTVPSTPEIVSKKSSIIQWVAVHKRLPIIADKNVDYDLQPQNTQVLKDITPDHLQNTSDYEVRVDANVAFVVIVLCAIFIPPLGVALMYGIHLYFWVDLILTLLFFFPGMIFALIVVLM